MIKAYPKFKVVGSPIFSFTKEPNQFLYRISSKLEEFTMNIGSTFTPIYDFEAQ